MRQNFVVTPEAKASLRDILSDFAEDSPEAAHRLRLRLYEGFQLLGRSPGMSLPGRTAEPTVPVSELLSFVAVYAWETSPIQIVSIVHGARDLAIILTLRNDLN